MKFLLLAVLPLLGLATENNAAPDSPVAAQVPGDEPFGLVAAQQLADARRRELHGECGMCIFKERIGDAWVFRTYVGYAGSPAPDITVFPPAKPQSAQSPGEVHRPARPLRLLRRPRGWPRSRIKQSSTHSRNSGAATRKSPRESTPATTSEPAYSPATEGFR